jgi:hypothetical protein
VLGTALLCLCTASAFRAPDCSAVIPRRRNALRRPPPRLPLASSACGSRSSQLSALAEAASAACSAAACRETAQSRRSVLGSGLSLVATGALAAGAPSEARAICGTKPQSWEFWIPVWIVTLFNDSHCWVARDRIGHVCVAADAVPGCSAIRVRACVRACVCACVHMYYLHTSYIHTHIHTYIRTYIHTYIHTHTHTHTHTYMHTYIHT